MQQNASPPTHEAWTLSDGHAGNVRQAQALAAAMGLAARDWTLPARAPWRWLSPRRLPGARHAFGADFAHALPHAPPLAIGCGRQGALATRLLRSAGARAIQILDPRIDPRHWDLVVAPAHDGLSGANVITLLGSLHPVDDLWLAAARQQFVAFAQLPQPRTAVLLGGTSAHADVDLGALSAWLDALAARIAQEGGSVLATASRRTPAAARALLHAKLAALPGIVWRDADDGANPYAGLLGWADRIVCTADSVNMLSEAAATNVPVHVCGVQPLQGRPRRFVDSLLALGRIREFTPTLDAFAVVPLRETARVAAEARERLRL
ncbi:mitochondrial fission ELM1 family protein [Lysobacter solisilvae (ex Woo and Kim 2020)]|uniref:Mitochondrial fission ELM1 family protein n=1 Tax=Agrilutibacter terrestris TaxID=2865112 RepID=A0A7H0FZU3_9GAMM|nr:mitochondrial fission ELM1 family protein [Lysobacter terrestris]QNP41559.1 mitochondrial fission ELM1 family protein [Lysobacter terrestris]